MEFHKWIKVTRNSLGFPDKGWTAWRCTQCSNECHNLGKRKPEADGCRIIGPLA